MEDTFTALKLGSAGRILPKQGSDSAPAHYSTETALKIGFNTCGLRQQSLLVVYVQKTGTILEQGPTAAPWIAEEFESTRRRLEQNLMRLDLWMSDCLVNDPETDYLLGLSENITSLLGEVLFRVNQSVSVISDEIRQLPSEIAHSKSESGSRTERDMISGVSASLARINEFCGAVATHIHVLAKMQGSIQMNQAIKYKVGPQASLHDRIIEVKRDFIRKVALINGDREVVSGVESEDRSLLELDETCAHCKKTFSLGALEFHQEFCEFQKSPPARSRDDSQPKRKVTEEDTPKAGRIIHRAGIAHYYGLRRK